MSSPSAVKLRIAAKLVASTLIPAVPIILWWKDASEERKLQEESVRTKVRIPNVPTVDELLIEKMQPGDVILFDRRCDLCADGPLAALNCFVGRRLLCDDEDGGVTGVRSANGVYDHCGVVVPGKDRLNNELLLLEATAGEGVVARPLLTRLEMSRSRSVILLPLSSPGERNRRNENDDEFDESDKTLRLKEALKKNLAKFKDSAVQSSKNTNYDSSHSMMGVTGALGYGLNLHDLSPSPVSPSAWVVVSALQSCGAAENVDGRAAFKARVEDFLRDHRFNENDTIRLRPGWKFLPPVALRETSRSA